MTMMTGQTPRRTFLTTGGFGAVAMLGFGSQLEARQTTDAEKANNIRVVNGFCAAFATHDLQKIGSFLAETAVWRPDNGSSSTGATAIGRDAILARISRFLDRIVAFEVVQTFATGSIVLNERYDRFMPERALHLAGVFFMKEGKIVEWTDYL
jgi:limonene-1,2-epoxide hydrolase